RADALELCARHSDGRLYRQARRPTHRLIVQTASNQKADMTLSPAELERYARHIVLRDVGGPGQQRLKAARVLVIGAGGLGAPVLQYLAAAGVGTLGIVDDDTVSLSNLQRQVIHDTESLGEPKVASAAAAIARLNPHVAVEPHPVRLRPENALALVSRYALGVVGSVHFSTP